jgi:hypothetical protein
MLGSSWVATQLVVSQERISSKNDDDVNILQQHLFKTKQLLTWFIGYLKFLKHPLHYIFAETWPFVTASIIQTHWARSWLPRKRNRLLFGRLLLGGDQWQAMHAMRSHFSFLCTCRYFPHHDTHLEQCFQNGAPQNPGFRNVNIRVPQENSIKSASLSNTPWRRVGEWRYSWTILDTGTIWTWVISFMLPTALPRRKQLRYALEMRQMLLLPRIEPRPWARSQSLYQLSYSGS